MTRNRPRDIRRRHERSGWRPINGAKGERIELGPLFRPGRPGFGQPQGKEAGLGQDPRRDGSVGGRQIEEHGAWGVRGRADVGLETATALRDSASAWRIGIGPLSWLSYLAMNFTSPLVPKGTPVGSSGTVVSRSRRFSSSKDVLDHNGGVGLHRAAGCDTDGSAWTRRARSLGEAPRGGSRCADGQDLIVGGRATPARGRHPRGYAARTTRSHGGHRGAAVGQPSEVGSASACGPHRLGSRVWRGPLGSSAGVGETWSVGTSCGSLWPAAALRCGQS